MIIAVSALPGSSFAAGQVRVMTFNIQHGVGSDGALNLSRTAATITSVNPDIVGMQEVDVFFSPRSNCADQVAALAALLPMYPYRYFNPSLDYPGDLFQCGWAHRRQYGNLILSKFPIVAAQKTSLPRFGGESRVLLSTLVFTTYGCLAFHDTHLGIYSAAERDAQAQATWNAVVSFSGFERVVLGDFNAAHFDASLSALWTRMNEAIYAATGRIERPDLIYTTIPASRIMSAAAFDVGASDHPAQWADLWMP